MDFWASRVHTSKHLSAIQAAQLNNSEYQFVDQTEDDGRAWFPCPFCYIEVEIPILCRHLQEEHCFDLKNAVCPICAANLGKNPIEHFTVQHSHSVKRRKKSYVGSGYNGSRMVMKDIGEMNSLNGTNWESNVNCRVNNETALDPLLSPFFCSTNNPKSNQQHELSSNTASSASHVIACTSTSSNMDEDQEEDCEERRQKAAFVQQLIFSTIF